MSEGGGEPWSVALVEDEGLLADALRIALSRTGRVEVVGVFGDGPAALTAIPALRPRAVLLDISLPGGINGVHLGRLLRRALPGLGVVLLSHYRDPAVLSGVPEAELAGWSYLLKSSVRDVPMLLRAIEGTVAGQVVLDPDLMRPPALEELAPRQVEILGLIAQGYSNAAIAERLVISQKTVENQINAMFRVLGIDPEDRSVQPRVRAVLTYLRATGQGGEEGTG